MTRILHAVRSDGFAGVEQYAVRLAKLQSAAGHEVTLIGGDPAKVGPLLSKTGVRSVPAASVLDVYRQLRRLRARDFDIVHAHMTAAECAALAPGSGARRSKIVSTIHFSNPRGADALRRQVFGMLARGLSIQIAVSRYVAAHVTGPCVVAYPGTTDAPDRSEPRDAIVLVVQRLEPEKETSVAIRAFHAAGLARQGWQLQIAGSGSDLPGLQALAAELDIADAVSFLGYRTDVLELMAAASVLIAPTRIEGFGLTVVEAMAVGLPVVAADGGAHPETVGHSTPEFLFAPGDFAGAATHLNQLADSRTLRDTTGRTNQRTQREFFSEQSMLASVDNAYRMVLQCSS